MTVALNSYINFNGNAREAMDFYKSIFGGEVYSDTFAKYESTGMPVAPGDRDKIMHAYLKGDNGIELMGSDAMGDGPASSSNEQISLAVSGDDEAALRAYWDGLAAEGTVTVPMNTSPWGDTFGMLTDKFGVKWMVNIGKPKDEQGAPAEV
ncbi:MAG: VOC family protein [Candidatus Saccharimonas sp.]